MSIITRLVAGKKNSSRVNLYLDGVFAFALSLDEVVKNGLKKGLELSDELVQSLKKTDDLNWIYAKILNYLSYRPHSEFEVVARLKKYGVVEDGVRKEIIQRLINEGYLSDLEFAKWFIESRTNSRPRSNRHLTMELIAKGIDRALINQLLNDVSETVSLDRLIIKKSTLSRDKLIQFLLRRGFKYGQIQAKLDELGIKG